MTISEDELRRLYLDERLSLQEIAERFQCSRPNIHYFLKKYGIAARTHSEARWLALQKGKFSREVLNEDGKIENRVLDSGHVKKDFFRSWTPESAYVLGVLYSDGCLIPLHNTIEIGQKEPELLEKIRALMGSEAIIAHSPKRGIAGALYHLKIGDVRAYEDLVQIGLTPRKSKIIDFPDVPLEHARHFLRGCWDGDGSITRIPQYRNRTSYRASYVSGSDRFIIELVETLFRLGIPRSTPSGNRYVYRRRAAGLIFPDSNRRISIDSRSGAYYAYFYGDDCARLFTIFYEGVDADQRLDRKFQRFQEASEHAINKRGAALETEISLLRRFCELPTKPKMIRNIEREAIERRTAREKTGMERETARRAAEDGKAGLLTSGNRLDTRKTLCGHPLFEIRREFGTGRWYCMACNREHAAKRKAEQPE